MLNELKQRFGVVFMALLIGAAVFMLPKIIHDDYVFFKEVLQKEDK